METTLVSPVVIWFFIGLLLLVIELGNPGFILFFFGVGAWVVSITLLIVEINTTTQISIFLATSLLSLILLRNKFKELFSGYLKGKGDTKGDLDPVAGKLVKVTQRITPNERGKVELFGTSWTAEADTEIEAGSMVRIVKKENIILTVEKI